jgi:hypothetical protein
MDDTRYDRYTLERLDASGFPTRESATSLRPNKGLPYNTAGINNLLVRNMPMLEYTNALGFVQADPRIKNLNENRKAQPNMFVRPSAKADTVGHEAEHLLARQQLGHPAVINDKFDELTGNWRYRHKFVEDALAVAPYLKEKYGIDNGYFDPDYLKEGGTHRVFYEQLASLAGTEAAKNVDLTKDPILRQSLFKDRDVREAYNAITGLRQTRLDAKDLPPYTIQPEEPGLMEKLKKMLKFAEGGYIPNAGNKKLI